MFNIEHPMKAHTTHTLIFIYKIRITLASIWSGRVSIAMLLKHTNIYTHSHDLIKRILLVNNNLTPTIGIHSHIIFNVCARFNFELFVILHSGVYNTDGVFAAAMINNKNYLVLNLKCCQFYLCHRKEKNEKMFLSQLFYVITRSL